MARSGGPAAWIFIGVMVVGFGGFLVYSLTRTPEPGITETSMAQSEGLQPIVDRWAKVDPQTLPAGQPALARSRKVAVVFTDTLVAYAPGSNASECFATKPDEVGVVVVAHPRSLPEHMSASGVHLVDKEWNMRAIALPEGKLVASWTRVSVASTKTFRRTGNTSVTNELRPDSSSFAGFPNLAFEADCVALQAGRVPDSD